MGDDALEGFDDLALLRRALALMTDLDAGATDDDGYWVLVRELHRRGTRSIFDEAERLGASEDQRALRLACDVLGQLGYEQGRPFAVETLPLLARVCAEDPSPAVLDSAISALGHLGTPESCGLVVAHAAHADASVRLAVACALPSIAGVEWLPATHPAVVTLMALSSDADSDVRDWATFGLGSRLDADGSEVRRCLLARVDDPDEDTRAEAIAGLARRHAPGTAPLVEEALGAETVGRLTVEAALQLGHPMLAEPLARLAQWWDVDRSLLDRAMRRCDPGRIDATARLAAELVAAAEADRLGLGVSSPLLDENGAVVAVLDSDAGYGLDELMQRAAGSVDAAVRLIRQDLAAVVGVLSLG